MKSSTSKTGLKPRPQELIFCDSFFRVHERICSDITWQVYLLKNWPGSFYMAKKNCQLRIFVRVYDSTHKCGVYKTWQPRFVSRELSQSKAKF